MSLEVAVLGNFSVPWATANDLSAALEALGHTPVSLHEPEIPLWEGLIARMDAFGKPDAVIWNRTPAHSAEIGHKRQMRMLRTAREAGIPTIAVHLDRWWGLKREPELFSEPYFLCKHVFTADGHPQRQWGDLGINHEWSPAAIGGRWVEKSLYDHRYLTDVLFVGSHWGYHEEWGHRAEMIRWLKRFYGKRFRQIPDRKTRTIRGERLGAVYASAKVIVGDSCLVPDDAGEPYTHYHSDRIPETLGRGGFLVHPYVKGVTDGTLYESGDHLACFDLGDFRQMRSVIDHYLKHDEQRRKVAEAGMEHVRTNHTYERRLEVILKVVGLT
jgi:hypothetical protein